jgi:hypothetical protein
VKKLSNTRHYVIGLFYVGLLAITKGKGKTFDKLKKKIEYRIEQMN